MNWYLALVYQIKMAKDDCLSGGRREAVTEERLPGLSGAKGPVFPGINCESGSRENLGPV